MVAVDRRRVGEPIVARPGGNSKQGGLGPFTATPTTPPTVQYNRGGNAFLLLREHRIHLSFCTAAVLSQSIGSPSSRSSALAAPLPHPGRSLQPRDFSWQHRRQDTARSGSVRDTHLTSPPPYSTLPLPRRPSVPTTSLQRLVDRMHRGGETRDNAADFLASRPEGPYCPTTA